MGGAGWIGGIGRGWGARRGWWGAHLRTRPGRRSSPPARPLTWRPTSRPRRPQELRAMREADPTSKVTPAAGALYLSIAPPRAGGISHRPHQRRAPPAASRAPPNATPSPPKHERPSLSSIFLSSMHPPPSPIPPPKNQALVFTQFGSTLEWLQAALPAAGFSFRCITGAMGEAQRTRAIEVRCLREGEAGGLSARPRTQEHARAPKRLGCTTHTPERALATKLSVPPKHALIAIPHTPHPYPPPHPRRSSVTPPRRCSC